MAWVANSSPYLADSLIPTLDEKLASLFQPDMLVYAQYFEGLHRKALLEPEKKLMLAILEDAVNCFQNNVLARSGRRKRLFKEVEEWFLEEDDDWLFSFGYICEVLGLNSQYVRRGLLRWKDKKQPEFPPGKSWGNKRMVGRGGDSRHPFRREGIVVNTPV
jgi:hypothetical protein